MSAYEVTYEGIVQYVHFRAAIAGLAALHRVTGWVQNQQDGSVKAHFEGSNIKGFLESLAFTKRHTNAIPIVTLVKAAPLQGYTTFIILET